MGWIEATKTIRTGRVVSYVTHEEHREGGYVFPKGARCLATRTPSGELGLFFLVKESGDRDVARAVWLPSSYGLCGVEPGVLDPMKRNLGMVHEAVRRADQRVLQLSIEWEKDEQLETGIGCSGAWVFGSDPDPDSSREPENPSAREPSEYLGEEREDDMEGEKRDIGWAVRKLKEGAKICRYGWNGKGMWLAVAGSAVVNGGAADGEHVTRFVVMRVANGTFVPWNASQWDLLAEDWELFDR